MPIKSGVVKTLDHLARIAEGVKLLASQKVMVGIPQEKNYRKGDPINSAALLYIHEHGAPEVNIPARPTLAPGVREAKDPIAGYLKQAAGYALEGKPGATEKALNAAGIKGRDSVKAKIGSNTPPPLSPKTLAARKRRGVTRTNTLVDTAQMQGAVNYVIRKV